MMRGLIAQTMYFMSGVISLLCTFLFLRIRFSNTT